MGKKRELLIKLGKRIRELRKARGLSQEMLANEAGVDRSYMGNIERGENNPTVTSIVKIAKGLKVEVGELFPPIKNICNHK